MVEKNEKQKDTFSTLFGMEPANEIQRLQARIYNQRDEIRRLEAEVEQLKRFKHYWDSLYGQGLEVANWHQNGTTESFDSFYEDAIECLNKERGKNDE